MKKDVILGEERTTRVWNNRWSQETESWNGFRKSYELTTILILKRVYRTKNFDFPQVTQHTEIGVVSEICVESNERRDKQ